MNFTLFYWWNFRKTIVVPKTIELSVESVWLKVNYWPGLKKVSRVPIKMHANLSVMSLFRVLM